MSVVNATSTIIPYEDYELMSSESCGGSNDFQAESCKKTNRLKRNRRAPIRFVDKLHEICSRDDLNNIICWNDDGDGWTIPNGASGEDLLSSLILPLYFGKFDDPLSSSLEMFYLNVHLHGFRRDQSTSTLSFHHKNFVRDNTSLLQYMPDIQVTAMSF